MTEIETISEKRIVLLGEIDELQKSLRDKQRLLQAIEIVLEDMLPKEAYQLMPAAVAPSIPVAECDESQKNAIIVLRLDDGTTAITATKIGVNRAITNYERRAGDLKVVTCAYAITDCEDTARNIQGALAAYLVSQAREVYSYRYDRSAFDEAVGFVGYISALPQITHLHDIAEVEGFEQQSEWQFLAQRDQYAAMVRQFYEKLYA